MFDMAVECGAAINIENKLGLTPLTVAAYLAKYPNQPTFVSLYLTI